MKYLFILMFLISCSSDPLKIRLNRCYKEVYTYRYKAVEYNSDTDNFTMKFLNARRDVVETKCDKTN